MEEGLLTVDEAEECIGVEFNPVRVGFHGGTQVWTRDVLNVGVQPDKLIAKVGDAAAEQKQCARELLRSEDGLLWAGQAAL